MAVNDLDAKTRAVEKMKAEPGNEFAAYQAAENQLLAIRAEQKQNLAAERQENAATSQQNAMIGQVAELVGGSGGGAAAVQAPVNAPTQNVLAKYGAGPTITKTQRSTQQVTKQNITINNYNTTTNTVNNPAQPAGPLQGRPVVVNNDSGRFKVWVNNVIASQNEKAAIRDREYQRRESVLTRSANKMTRKLESISTNISKALDPRKTRADLESQIKTVMKLMGLGFLALHWPQTLDLIGNIEKKFRIFLEYIGFSDRDERKKTGEESGLTRDVKFLLLGENAGNVKGGILAALKELLLGDKGLVNTLRKSFQLWAENRGKAINALKAPSIWNLGGVMEYLQKIISILLEGPGGAIKNVAKEAREEGTNKMTAEDNIYHKKSGKRIEVNGEKKDVSYGDAASVIHDVDSSNAKYHLMREDLTEKGDLRNNLGASLRQSNYLANNFFGGKATGGTINVSGILEGLNRLEKTAGKKKTVLVDPKFIKALETLGIKIENLDSKKKEYGFIARKKTDEEKLEEYSQNSGIAGAVGAVGGTIVGAGTAVVTSGGGINAAGSLAAGAYVGNEARKSLENWAQDKASEEYTYQLTPKGLYSDKSYHSFNQESGVKKYFDYFELTEQDMQSIKSQLAKLTGRGDNFSYDATDVETTRAMAEYLTKKSPKKELDASYTNSLQKLTKLYEEKEEYDAAQKKIWDESLLNGISDRTSKLTGEAGEFLKSGYTDPLEGNLTVNTDKINGSIEEYKKAMKPMFEKLLENKNLPKDYADWLVAQSGLESNWGRSELSSKYNNYSGIKARAGEKAANMMTYEYIGGVKTQKKSNFAAYDSVAEWATRYIDLLNNTYQAFSGSFNDYPDKLTGNNKGKYRYATDPSYATKLRSLLALVQSIGIGENSEQVAPNDITPTNDQAVPFTQGQEFIAQNNDNEFPNMIQEIEVIKPKPVITPVKSELETPLLAVNTKTIATNVANNETSDNQGKNEKLEEIAIIAEKILTTTTITAEASARNVDATNSVSDAVSIGFSALPHIGGPGLSSTSLYTPPINTGEV